MNLISVTTLVHSFPCESVLIQFLDVTGWGTRGSWLLDHSDEEVEQPSLTFDLQWHVPSAVHSYKQ